MPKVYIKDKSYDPIYKSIDPIFYFKSKMISGGLIALGFVILTTQVIMPLIVFKTQDVTEAKPVTSSVLGLASGFNDFKFNELTSTNKPISNSLEQTGIIPDKFYLTIPKLGIQDAVVETNSKDLSPDDALGHYAQTALPGESGNTFIYGHSVLPWFYNPKNYKTIFSTLGDLTTGDVIVISYNNSEIKYIVESKVELLPDNVNPLAEFKPKYLNESTIELMTCWPAGTKAKRLIVRGVKI